MKCISIICTLLFESLAIGDSRPNIHWYPVDTRQSARPRALAGAVYRKVNGSTGELLELSFREVIFILCCLFQHEMQVHVQSPRGIKQPHWIRGITTINKELSNCPSWQRRMDRGEKALSTNHRIWVDVPRVLDCNFFFQCHISRPNFVSHDA